MAGNHEDVADSWEDADAEDLERRMEERRNELKPTDKKAKTPGGKLSDGMQRNGQLSSTFESRLRIQDSERTPYVAPVKILKRQESGSTKTPLPQTAIDESKLRKNLAEREAAYASARARILGQPRPPPVNSEVKALPTKSPPTFKQSS